MGSKSVTVGFWYHIAFHHGLGVGPFDAFLEFRGGDKVAWKGLLTDSGSIAVNAEQLWGGEKDQGGIVGELEWMNGEPGQMPNAYLAATFGDQQPAWRGLSTVVFKGGRYGAMNPYPQKPSYKIRRILKGWDDDVCWYPDKAAVPLGDWWQTPEVLDFSYTGGESFPAEYAISLGGGSGVVTMAYLTGSIPDKMVLEAGGTEVINTGYVGAPSQQSNLDSNLASRGLPTEIIHPYKTPNNNSTNIDTDPGVMYATFVKSAAQTAGVLRVYAPLPATGWAVRLTVPATPPEDAQYAMNPAHILYYSRTSAEMGREPASAINEASFIAAADWFYAQGFGLCASYDPSAESVEEFEQRICRVAGCGLTRSLINGQWYLDVANGQYDFATLPVLNDDDILEFEEQPTILDSVVNSVSVKYFDPAKKETITTSPAQAPALISDFGTNHLTLDHPEIPTAELAARVAQRELLARITPLRAFPLKTTRRPYAWRPSTYFRLQVPKRGIADLVCLLGEKSSGVLRSGAMTISASQDIYSLPAAAFVQVEPGVDTRPDQVPTPIVLQAVFEAPYTEVAAARSRADLAVLPKEASYLVTVAADPARSRDYTLTVDAGAGYAETATGDWTATAVVEEAAGFGDSAFTLANVVGGEEVLQGMPALWGSEIVRVDAFDQATGAITLARGCADTVPVMHAAGQRLWFFATGAAVDPTEYTSGESLAVKLLTNTGSQRLDPAAAAPLALVMGGRAARPYAPGRLRIAGEAAPAAATGAVTVTWVHRDRVMQADQLVDHEATGIGPEATTRYALRLLNASGALLIEKADIVGTSATFDLAYTGNVRLQLYAITDKGAGWQRHERIFAYTAGAAGVHAITADTYSPDDNITIIDGGRI